MSLTQVMLEWGLPVSAAMFGAAAQAVFTPRSRMWGPLAFRGCRSGPPRVAMSFDDGPTPRFTGPILDALGEMNVKAAFFVVGTNLERAPDLVARITREGHLVGNHSYDHAHFGLMRPAGYWRDQLGRCNDAIEQVTGRRPALFRPPMGFTTPFIHWAAHRLGLRVVTWTRRAFDGVCTDPQRILDRLAPRARAGDILALHDGIDPNYARDLSATVAAIRPLVQGLRQRGIEPVRLDELLGVHGYAEPGPQAPQSPEAT